MKENAIVINNFNSNSIMVKNSAASIVVAPSNEEEGRKKFSLSLANGVAPIDVFSKDKNNHNVDLTFNTLFVSDKQDKDIIIKDSDFKCSINIPFGVRYIKDSVSGSTASSGSHWCELQALMNKENVALNKPFSMDGAAYKTGELTNGTFNTSHITASNYVMVDLGEVYNIDTIVVSHYPDGRKFYKVKLEVSKDGTEWFTLFDAEKEGTYSDVSGGRAFDVRDGIAKYQNPLIKESVLEEKQSFKVDGTAAMLLHTPTSKVVALSKNNDAIIQPLKEVRSYSIFHDRSVQSDVISIVSRDKAERDFSVGNNFKQASMIVSTKIPVDSGNGVLGGEGLKALNLELQPMSYINMKLDFSTMDILDVVGLPPGLKLEEGYIKGSPVISGDYNTKILLSNGTFIPGKIKVHVLDRKL